MNVRDKKRFVFAERRKALEIAASCGLSVVSEEQELTGYQIYIVEQWVCDRKETTNVVKVFTGDETHKIKVAVIAISTAELQHPRPQVQSFLNLSKQLKSKPTPLGEILLTDPSELPFDMDMVLIPGGDYDLWIKQAYVNINLRRTNCTGRSSLNLLPPNPASEEKFRSLYKIADTVNFEDAVINLVSLVQIALYLFKLLNKDDIDGLICNQTTAALWTFYTKYDPVKTTDFTLKEPWMEPHLLAAIISKLIMCRNKLQDSNFTTVKDPFMDYDTFRFDIGDYQRYKNIRPTKFIDLDTLSKLNGHSSSQLKMKKVIKSKLDDISGITNSPLFNETSDPEVFRHHATMESLRSIWRPRLRGGNALTPINTTTSYSAYDQPNELIHMIKGVSRSGGAALSRVAGSLPWMSEKHKVQHFNVTIQEPEPQLSSSLTMDADNVPNRRPSPLSIETTSIKSNNSSVAAIEESQLSPDHLDKDMPSYVPIKPKLRISKSSDTAHKAFKEQEGDFIPYIQPKATKRHTRSFSDSLLFDPQYKDTLVAKDELMSTTLPVLKHERSFSIPSNNTVASNRPSVKMNIKTYMAYEKLVNQQRQLQQTYQELKYMADMYETTANALKSTYEKRSLEFELIQRESRSVLEEQNITERRLKAVEDNSAKLHYELKVLNDKLKDIEENVGTFYGKVGLLERKMDDSQQSITTMLIIGNYLNHYWVKVREWFYASSSSDFNQNK